MVNDTVREELQTKIAPVTLRSGDLAGNKMPSAVPQVSVQTLPVDPPQPRTVVRPVFNEIQSSAVKKPEKPAAPKPQKASFETSDLKAKKTSPTLVGFQPKNAALPDWRLQLQNSIRQRTKGSQRGSADISPSTYQKQIVTSGANALKMEFIEEEKSVEHSNPRVAKALKRIEDSRKTFLTPQEEPEASNSVPSRNYPFNVVSKAPQIPAKQADANITVSTAPKPKLVSSLRIEKKGYDTNKLPPITKPAEVSTSFGISVDSGSLTQETNGESVKELGLIDNAPEIEIVDSPAQETEEIDDLAPLSMRFNAGLFDLIIGVFASSVLLSPFMLTGGSWLTPSGILAFSATTAIVMFLYLTISIGFFGRSVGMRLFSLELLDANENAYPTLHQAAVHSSVFIVTIASGGLGFLPMFFNEERRAAHDLVSGTILLREY